MTVEGTGDQRTHAHRRADASNVLLEAPPGNGAESTACTRLLQTDAPERTAVLGVTYTRSADDWLADVREAFGTAPADLAVIEVEGLVRGAAGTASQSAERTAQADVTTVAPGDLTGLGIRISEFVERVQTAADRDLTPVLCYDAVTDLLQTTDCKRAFRFLHLVTARIRTAGATAHYHIHPAVLDAERVETLAPLFDARVRADGRSGTPDAGH